MVGTFAAKVTSGAIAVKGISGTIDLKLIYIPYTISAEGEGDGDREIEALRLADGEVLGEIDGERLVLGLTLAEREGLLLGLTERDIDAEGLTDGELEALGLSETEALGDSEMLGLLKH